MAQYFPGIKNLATFILTLHDGNANLRCTISEEWRVVCQDVARCKATGHCNLTKRLGLKKSDREALDGSIKSSIGLSGVAKLESEVKAKMETEVVWEEETVEDKGFAFVAPDCGRYMALKYQLLRLYRLDYQDHRLFHKDSWSRTITERLNIFDDASKQVLYDEDCGCGGSRPKDYNEMYHVDMGNIGMLVPGWRTPSGCELDFQGTKVIVEISLREVFRASIGKDLLPESLLFLAGDNRESYDGVFTPYSEPAIRSASDSMEFAAEASLVTVGQIEHDYVRETTR